MSKLDEVQWQYLRKSLDEMEYGSVIITVHDGRVTQMDITEKKRFTNTSKNHSLQKCK
ncbi:YezD family protein [Virgibacillus proomii]|uniref:YezD family protein n=1 Tax=Virgibacillus proomii TaxID=84407 RepID=UPI001C10B512|nr:YezD family protein [Virgibacillus proomii]MBU5267926.1 YezD family protein [Virgibacillus proomii]